MNKKRTTLGMMMLAVMLTVPGGLQAAEEKKPGGRGNPMEVMTRELDLTGEQQEKIRAIMEKRREAGQEMRDATKEQMMEHRAATQREIDAVLTPEQQERMKELREERRKKMEERREQAGERREKRGTGDRTIRRAQD